MTWSRARYHDWTRATIAAAIWAWAQAHGRAPGSRDFRASQRLPSDETVRRHYGSLAAARVAAGCAPGRRKPERSFVAAVAAYLAREATR